MTTAVTAPERHASPTPPRRGVLPRILISLTLGLLSTVAVAQALAAWVDIASAPATIALDGNHLQPWLIRLESPGATRTLWFEKGRVYNAASQTSPMARSMAVSCWSFAMGARRDTRTRAESFTPTVPITELIEPQPPLAWGVAHDQRGYPFPAFESRIRGHMLTSLPGAYTVEWGRELSQPAAAAAGQANLANIRILPWKPVPVGLIANTLVHSAAWWVLLTISASLVSRIRRRPGACPGCGYDLRGIDQGCPECGLGRPATP